MKKQIILLFHLGYWSFYVAMLAIVFLVTQAGQFAALRIGYILSIAFFFVLLPSILGFYISYFILFRSYIQHRKLWKLLGSGLAGILLTAFTSAGIITLIFGKNFMFKNGYESFYSEVFLMASIGFINGITGFILNGFISWYTDLRIKEKLQQQSQTMELELIKSKLDPHFLFNSINNIDGLMITDVAVASKYLDKLSTILRFMLYESREEKIPITVELEYIQKYIDLQKIRTTNRDFVKFTVSGEHFQHQIAPMLFIPFIENAFKHVASKKSFHAIEVDISIEAEEIVFMCKNNFNPNQKTSDKPGGIGNELIEKRLELLYPNQHFLEKYTSEENYSVQLTIMAHEN